MMEIVQIHGEDYVTTREAADIFFEYGPKTGKREQLFKKSSFKSKGVGDWLREQFCVEPELKLGRRIGNFYKVADIKGVIELLEEEKAAAAKLAANAPTAEKKVKETISITLTYILNRVEELADDLEKMIEERS